MEEIFDGTVDKYNALVNDTIISLILKKDHADVLTDFISISLYNVICKLGKLLANRLKIVIRNLFHFNQANFFLCHQIVDNIIIAQ